MEGFPVPDGLPKELHLFFSVSRISWASIGGTVLLVSYISGVSCSTDSTGLEEGSGTDPSCVVEASVSRRILS